MLNPVVPLFRRMHRWMLPSCGDIGRPSSSPASRPPSRSRDEAAARPSAPPRLRKAVSEGTLTVPKDVEEFLNMSAYGFLNLFTYGELRKANGDFDPGRIVGEGGFGVVYRGMIDGAVRKGHPPTEVAVKELNPEGLQGDREWLTEVSYLGQYSHPNLVELIGYCCEEEHRLLVYEFMAKGSLEHHLFRRSCSLSWSTRVKIALDVGLDIEPARLVSGSAHYGSTRYSSLYKRARKVARLGLLVARANSFDSRAGA